jgi:hypothetical protein
MKLYAYGLSNELFAPTFETPIGIAGAQPYLIEHEKISAVVSDFDGNAVPVTRENIFAHERVLDHVLAQVTPLPFRFGMVVEAGKLEEYLGVQKTSLLSALARVRGCVEMGIKIIWEPETVRGRVEIETAPAARGQSVGTGTAFLMAKRHQIRGGEAMKARAAEIADWLSSSIGDLVRASEVQVQPEKRLVVAAAYLVERQRLDEYRNRLAGLQDERKDLRFLTSGPWPPYSFADINA